MLLFDYADKKLRHPVERKRQQWDPGHTGWAQSLCCVVLSLRTDTPHGHKMSHCTLEDREIARI